MFHSQEGMENLKHNCPVLAIELRLSSAHEGTNIVDITVKPSQNFTQQISFN